MPATVECLDLYVVHDWPVLTGAWVCRPGPPIIDSPGSCSPETHDDANGTAGTVDSPTESRDR